MSAKGKGICRWGVKFLIANVFAVLCFSIVGYFYYYGGLGIEPPIADEVWKRATPNSRVFRLTEGVTNVRLDSNGFNNEYYLEHNLDLSDVDVLAMGSSHVEAFGVDKCFAYCLNERFADSASPKRVYQCGSSSHTLASSVARYENALKLFQPKQYVVLETYTIPGVATVESALENTFKNRPMSARFRPLFRRFWGTTWGVGRLNQFLNFRKKNKDKAEEEEAEVVLPDNAELKAAWAKLAKRVVALSREYEVTPIILFHSNAKLTKDLGVEPTWDVENLAAFRAICEREGVVFVDATERFREEYEKNDVWAYGFCNAGIVSGHLNRDGHRMVADVLEEKIRELEAERKESEAQQ